ncbi:nuclear transport factor 2 family protein [Lacisediminimonas profundi]|uniref:nuclear transport factor 2 family protein n=1 Tax=Lacisediminimonas profundi TaxID=2603856 RepID=UPI00124B5EBA|nr:nuclear transport factor 2 family protein [Lacisediminimonas profundi]
MNEQQLIEKVKQGNALFIAGDIQQLVGGFADDVEWVMADIPGVPFAKTWKGKQEVAQFFKTFSESLRTSRYEPREYIAQGKKVVVLGYYAGEAKPTGRALEGDWVQIFSYNNEDKLCRFQQFTDTAAYQAAFSPVMTSAATLGTELRH